MNQPGCAAALCGPMLAPLLLLLLLAATAAADPDCCGNLSHYPRSVSTSYSAGGRTPGRSVETFAFTPEVLERSLLSMGDPADWAKLVASLAARRCVRVLALGGANTCHGGGYWQKLYEPLNARFPCDGSDGRGGGDRAHAVDRLCSPHGGSEHWADFAATALALARDVPPGGERGVGGGVPSAAGGPEHAKLLRADLILVDTSVSDWFLCASDACLAAAYPRAAAHTARWTEVLLHLLRALPQRPALLWVGTASPGAGAAGAVGVWDGATPRRSDGTHAQAAVTRHHGVAHVSPLDSMGPLGGPAAPGDGPRDWFLQAYRRPGDPTGALLSDFAHHLVAEFIAQAVFAHFWEARRGPGAWRTGVGPDGAPRWPAAPPAKSDAERRVEAALAGGARRGGGRGAAAPPQPPRPRPARWAARRSLRPQPPPPPRRP